MVGDVNENGRAPQHGRRRERERTFVSEDAAAYSSEMNELIAKVFVDTKVQAMSATSPMADWSAWMASTPLMTVVEEVTQREFDNAYAPGGGVQFKCTGDTESVVLRLVVIPLVRTHCVA